MDNSIMGITAADYKRLAEQCERLAGQATDSYDFETLSGIAAILHFEASRKNGENDGMPSRLAGAFAQLRKNRRADRR